MSSEVKHFSLHRIDSTELRVIADAEVGVLPVIGVEEEVIRKYIEQGAWIHQYVTLFILQDMGPLTRQLQSVSELPPGGAEALGRRPVVNVYDLADPSGCQIFINWEAMVREGYWDEPSIVRALLAHEHAHPFAECAATAAARRLRVEIAADNLSEVLEGVPGADDRAGELRRIPESMGHKLCADAPREVLTNEFAIRAGFADAMMYLDSRNVANAAAALAGREQLRAGLQEESDRGRMTRAQEEVMRECPILPVRFDTIAPDADSVRHKLLDRRCGEFAALFEEIVANNPRIRQLRDSLVGVSEQRSHYDKVRLGEMVADAVKAKREAESEQLMDRFGPLAYKTRTNNTLGDRMVLNAAFLVDRSREDDFDRAVHELDSEQGSRLMMKFIGSAPPYNFVNIVVRWDE